MKRIIYTAVALIICASAFGIADYLNAKKQGTLVNYTDEEETTEAVIPEKKKEIAMIKKEAVIASTQKVFKNEKEIAKKSFKSIKKYKSPSVKSHKDVAVTEKTKDAFSEKMNVSEILHSGTVDENKTDTTIKVNNKRKINLEMFSRAPIRIKKVKK